MRRADLGSHGLGLDPVAAGEAARPAGGVAFSLALPAVLARHRAGVALGLLLLVTAALYVPSLTQWFLSDDFMFVNAAQDADDLTYISDAFDFRGAPPFPEGRFYRPLHSTAFVVLYDAFGLHATAYHAWSLALHLTSTVFVWLICRRLTKNHLASWLAAALFALHPAHASAVGWISNNNALMATCVALASFLCFMRAGDGGERRWLWYGGSVAAFCAALLFHPEAGTLLGALIAYRVFIQNGPWRQALDWRRWIDIVPFVVAAAIYAGIQAWMDHKGYLPQADGFRLTFDMFRVYFGYLSAAVFPVPTDQRALDSAPHVVAAVAFSLAIVALLVARGRERPNVAAFAVAWFLIAVLPLSTNPFVLDVWSRKLYVAGPSLAIMLSLMITPVIESSALRREVTSLGAAVVLVVALGLSLAGWLSVERQQDGAWGANQSRNYVAELRETYPTLPAGTTLHIVGLPRHLAILSAFYDSYVVNLVGMYYDDIDVVVEHDRVVESPGASDVVFRYPPGQTEQTP